MSPVSALGSRAIFQAALGAVRSNSKIESASGQDPAEAEQPFGGGSGYELPSTTKRCGYDDPPSTAADRTLIEKGVYEHALLGRADDSV